MTTQTKITPNRERIGCYVDESAGSADDCNLRTIEFAEMYGFTYEELPDESDDDYGQILSETADDAVSFLNDNNETPYAYWTHEDNSLFLTPDIEGCKESVEFVSSVDQDYPDKGYYGEWLHVNDHGNCTLYFRNARGQDKEIWSVV